MVLSRACEHGIKAVVFLSANVADETKHSVAEIANQINSPEAFTAKILQKLVKADIVHSVKGKNGGFFMESDIVNSVDLLEIVEVIDGLDILSKCVLGLAECSNDNPCPVHDSYKQIRADLIQFLCDTPINQLSKRLQDGESVLRIN